MGSFDHALRIYHAQGISAEQLQTQFERLKYMPVYTAHTTEAKRRKIMEALRRNIETFVLFVEFAPIGLIADSLWRVADGHGAEGHNAAESAHEFI